MSSLSSVEYWYHLWTSSLGVAAANWTNCSCLWLSCICFACALLNSDWSNYTQCPSVLCHHYSDCIHGNSTIHQVSKTLYCILWWCEDRLVSANDWHMVKFFYILLLLILLLAISLLNFSLSLIISVGITLPCLLAAPISSTGYVFVCLYVCCAVFVCACVFICMCISPLIMSHTPHKNSPSFRLMNLMCVCSIRMYCGGLYYIDC